MVKLSNTEAELKKSVVYKKKHVLENVDKVFSNVQNSKKSNFFYYKRTKCHRKKILQKLQTLPQKFKNQNVTVI